MKPTRWPGATVNSATTSPSCREVSTTDTSRSACGPDTRSAPSGRWRTHGRVRPYPNRADTTDRMGTVPSRPSTIRTRHGPLGSGDMKSIRRTVPSADDRSVSITRVSPA